MAAAAAPTHPAYRARVTTMRSATPVQSFVGKHRGRGGHDGPLLAPTRARAGSDSGSAAVSGRPCDKDLGSKNEFRGPQLAMATTAHRTEEVHQRTNKMGR